MSSSIGVAKAETASSKNISKLTSNCPLSSRCLDHACRVRLGEVPLMFMVCFVLQIEWMRFVGSVTLLAFNWLYWGVGK